MASLPRVRAGDSEDVAAGAECSVCQEGLGQDRPAVLLPCKHAFHEDCLGQWLERVRWRAAPGPVRRCRSLHLTAAAQHHTCPVCRFELPPQVNR